jgi:hypothetical protein
MENMILSKQVDSVIKSVMRSNSKLSLVDWSKLQNDDTEHCEETFHVDGCINLGVYENEEVRLFSFLREIGRMKSLFTGMEREIDAVHFSIKVALKFKINFSNNVIRWAVEDLLSL